MYGLTITTTEQVFVPDHLSRLSLGPGQKVTSVPGPTACRASGGGHGPFVPVGVTNPDKRPLYVIVQKEVILY